MIKSTTGDILNADTECLVNTVNCVGIMGRGIALQFKKTYPDNFKLYEAACKRQEVLPGQMFVYDTGQLTYPRYIINFPTKRHWRGKTRMDDIESGLADLVEVIKTNNIRSIAIPPLGCGLGGLDWKEVKLRITSALDALENVQVIVYEPDGAPTSKNMAHVREVPTMTRGRASLITLMQRYLDGFLDPTISLLEVHKLLYFLQESGEPLRLNYEKAEYGPYAKNLRHLLHVIEGHFVYGYDDGGDAPHKQLDLVPGAVKDADAFLDAHEQTRQRLGKVTELIEGFESSFGLELLATVHWIVKHDEVRCVDDVIKNFHEWSKRKKKFTDRQIKLAVDALEKTSWIDPMPA